MTRHHLVADDFHLEGGPSYREALTVFFILQETDGVPLSWSKTAGGGFVSLFGFELLLVCFCKKSDNPLLMIFTLEVPAVVIWPELFCGTQPKEGKTQITLMPSWTDNWGNGAAESCEFSTCGTVKALNGG